MRVGSFAAVALICVTVSAQAQMDRYDALANSPMVEGLPTPQTAALLKDEPL
jgi:hypothetical protein